MIVQENKPVFFPHHIDLSHRIFLTGDRWTSLTTGWRLGPPPEFELLAAGHGVPHAGAAERVHVLHDDERRLLQRHDGQMVVPLLGSRVEFEAGPHVEPHRQQAPLPLAHLRRRQREREREPRRRPTA